MPKFEACVRCGGTEYYNEAGFYYCNECQLQTQEVQEFEFDDEAPQPKTTTLVIQKEKKKVEQVTSWECYNYVLLGLTNELMDLGAEEKFKKVVQALWFKYLKSIEVIREDPCDPPKLQAYNNKVDAEIVYKRVTPKTMKRKRRSSMSSNSEGGSSTLSKRERGRLKQALMQAEYEAMSTQMTDSSLHNVSLSSLANLSEESKKQQYLQYEKQAIKELQNLMKPRHLTKHIQDVNNELTCHKIKYTDFRNHYRFGPEVLNRSKLYIIIYLALLISRERIHLGDLLRFMHEGHVSLNHLKQFFPEFLLDKALNMNNLKKNQHVYSHHYLRKQTAKFALYLKVEDLIVVPDLIDMTKRYCVELNLPDEVCKYVINLITHTQPRLKLKKERYKFPNYEGRVICLIIFVLKLFFGLDGVTEFELSNLTKLNETEKELFNFKDWLNHICLRKLVLIKHHFPTQFLYSKDISGSSAYIEHMQGFYDGLDLECDNNIEYSVISDLLGRLKERIQEKKSSLKFEPSFTPFRDYIQLLINNNTVEDNGYLQGILLKVFKNASLDYLYTKNFFDERVEEVKGGANEDVNYVPLFFFKNANSTENEKVFACEFTDDHEIPITSQKPEVKLRPSIVSNILYKPETSYWMLSGGEFDNMTHDYFSNYFKTFPNTFRFVIEECARITGQSLKDIIEELNIVESFLCYVFNFENGKVSNHLPDDETAVRLVEKYKKFW